jgi:superfamily II DNA or RNA helicase
MASLVLRDYQLDIRQRGAALARAEVTAGRRHFGLAIQMATGAGKTATALSFGLDHLERSPDNLVLWFAHRDELVEQPVAKLRSFGIDPAVIRAGEQPRPGARFYVASIQTALARGLASLPRPSMVVYDEARHYVAPRWGEIARAIGEKAVRLLLDATPVGDLRALAQHMIQGPTVSSLVTASHLVQPVHYGPEEETDVLWCHPVTAYQRHLAPDRAIVFCPNVAQAQRWAADALERDIAAAVVHGNLATAERRRILADYQRGAIDVLFNAQLLCEGADLPSTAGIIFARGVSSEGTWVQIGGRALRPSPGKSIAKIVDLYGLTWRYGWLDDERAWGLDGDGPVRGVSLPAVVCCSKCLAWGPPSARCPGCGATTPPPKPPRIANKTLAELKKEKQDRRPRRGPEWALWCEIVAEARAAEERGRPWKPQAASMRYRAKTGNWPRWRVDHVPRQEGSEEREIAA